MPIRNPRARRAVCVHCASSRTLSGRTNRRHAGRHRQAHWHRHAQSTECGETKQKRPSQQPRTRTRAQSHGHPPPRTYDVVIYGATGFTGQLAAEYLDTVVRLAREHETPKLDRLSFQRDRDFLHPERLGGLRWAIAGRTRSKLEEVRRTKAPTTCAGVVLADSDDAASIDAMCAQTRVVLSTAGPFLLFGSVVVEACVRHGTHYCDSTGETPWVRELLRRVHEDAVRTRALIVPMCGFDCVPADLGVLFAVQKLRERGCTSVARAHSYFDIIGGLSGGTLRTTILMDTPEHKRAFDDPFTLGGGPVDQAHLADAVKGAITSAVFDANLNAWTAPFQMEAMNTRVVRRSAADLAYRAASQGGFRYSESAIAQNQAKAEKMASAVAIPPDVKQRLIDSGKLPKPGEGPSFEMRRKARCRGLIHAESEPASSPGERKQEVWVSVTTGDCGYEDTALMCVESALVLALDANVLPHAGGVWTPAVGLGSNLIERLQLAGIRFQLVVPPPSASGKNAVRREAKL